MFLLKNYGTMDAIIKIASIYKNCVLKWRELYEEYNL